MTKKLMYINAGDSATALVSALHMKKYGRAITGCAPGIPIMGRISRQVDHQGIDGRVRIDNIFTPMYVQ